MQEPPCRPCERFMSLAMTGRTRPLSNTMHHGLKLAEPSFQQHPHPQVANAQLGASPQKCSLKSETMQVGLLASAPLFAQASKHYPGFQLIAFGLGIWVLAVAGTGLSFSMFLVLFFGFLG